ncbi:hypothetical protein OA529_03275 [Alphaproteobacteria bacterium]|nr:hypothetical protein [Alphaproteobacteria bacterium]
MNNSFPIWLVTIDYILAIIMAILILKFVLNLFINEQSNLGFFKFFTKLTNPILNITQKITPKFIVQPLIPLYVAWLFFMIRIYFLPLLLGYSYIGTFAFVFEKQIIEQIKSVILNIALYLNYGL